MSIKKGKRKEEQAPRHIKHRQLCMARKRFLRELEQIEIAQAFDDGNEELFADRMTAYDAWSDAFDEEVVERAITDVPDETIEFNDEPDAPTPSLVETVEIDEQIAALQEARSYLGTEFRVFQPA